MTTVTELRALALERTNGLPEGEPLDPLAHALIRLGVSASVTELDRDGVARAIEDATKAGASRAQLEEIVTLVSGLGVHSLMLALPMIAHEGTLDADRQKLWEEKVGADRFWDRFEHESPGFLRAMLALSPATFRAFFEYCALPWKSGTVSSRLKELVALATDATERHAFAPGFRLHLGNAIALGVGRRAIVETLDLASRKDVR